MVLCRYVDASCFPFLSLFTHTLSLYIYIYMLVWNESECFFFLLFLLFQQSNTTHNNTSVIGPHPVSSTSSSAHHTDNGSTYRHFNIRRSSSMETTPTANDHDVIIRRIENRLENGKDIHRVYTTQRSKPLGPATQNQIP